jgi:large subunit ribosomal protein L24
MQKLRKKDEIIVISGRDKGKTGAILSMSGQTLRVEGINLLKKHQKENPNTNQAAEIVSIEGKIHRSNVMLYNPMTKKGDRVKIKVLEDGSKVRVFASNNEHVDVIG